MTNVYDLRLFRHRRVVRRMTDVEVADRAWDQWFMRGAPSARDEPPRLEVVGGCG